MDIKEFFSVFLGLVVIGGIGGGVVGGVLMFFGAVAGISVLTEQPLFVIMAAIGMISLPLLYILILIAGYIEEKIERKSLRVALITENTFTIFGWAIMGFFAGAFVGLIFVWTKLADWGMVFWEAPIWGAILFSFLCVTQLIIDDREKKGLMLKEQLEQEYKKWWNTLLNCFNEIEKNILPGIFFESKNLYDSIWELEKIQPEVRYIEAFDAKMKAHINWLRDIVRNNIYSDYNSISMCLSVFYCLKYAYQNDAGFDPIIDTFTQLREYADSASFFIQFPQYGDGEMAVADLSYTDNLENRISELEGKIYDLTSAFQNMNDEYYSNISQELPDIIYYSAEMMWCIAAKKPFDQNEFEKATEIFARYTKKYSVDNYFQTKNRYNMCMKNNQGKCFVEIVHVEQLLALIYAKNLIGGKNMVEQEKKTIMQWMDNAIAYDMITQCFLLPSALAWMGLYDLERTILRYFVEKKVRLQTELQERLSFLESGGNSNIKVYNADDYDGILYDSSSSDWNTEAFDLFFRKLDMTHKELNYSLEISRWAKTFPLSRGQKITQEQFEKEFTYLVEDFDGEVILSRKRAKALNLANVEYEDAFVFEFKTERNRCVSILFFCEKYGRNLNLTIIVMFTPESNIDTERLKKYALAIKDNIYVESFRESVLQAVNNVIRPKEQIYDENTDTEELMDGANETETLKKKVFE